MDDAAKYALLVRAVANRSGLMPESGRLGPITSLCIEAVLALEAGAMVEITADGPGLAGYLSARLTEVATKTGMPRTSFYGLKFAWPGNEGWPEDVAAVRLNGVQCYHGEKPT